MIKDTNIETMIKEAIAPLLKEIKNLKSEIKKLKQRPDKIVYLDKNNIK